MSLYSITITANEPDEITEEIEEKFKNRDKSSSKRLGDLIKSTYPTPLSPFKGNEQQRSQSKPNTIKKQKFSYKTNLKGDLKDIEDSKSTKVEDDNSKIIIIKNKVNELESLLNSCMINGLEFEDTFDKLIENDLVVVDNFYDKKNDS
jgi:hypothetical protein